MALPVFSGFDKSKLTSKVARRVTFGVCVFLGLVIGVGIFVRKPKTVSVTRAPEATPEVVDVPTPKPGWYLELDKINTTAPVILDVAGDDQKTYLKAIEKGVAQYKGTSHPGTEGNAVIFGHSSYLKNKPGDYKEVFKNLDKYVAGDVIRVRHDANEYNYKVVTSKIITDDDFWVIDSTPRQTLTLLTCWPPGSIAKRYVIQAERINETGEPWPTPTPSVKPKLQSQTRQS